MENKIDTKTLEKELSYDNTVILKYKIEYPQIISKNTNAQKFNDKNRKLAYELKIEIENNLYKEAKELYIYNKKNGYPVMIYEIDRNFTVTYNKGDLVSLYFDEYRFTGGAHGSTIRTSQTWDLIQGFEIPIDCFFPNEPDFVLKILRDIKSQIEVQIQSMQNQYFDDYCCLLIDSLNLESYYLRPEGIEIYFQQYDIAPYSSGIPTFLINYY